MHVQVTRQCDAELGEERKALFPGQVYELPDDEAARLIGGGLVVEIGTALPGVPKARGRAKAKAEE